MQIQVTGKNMSVGEALQSHVDEKLKMIAEKYFENPIEAHVTFRKDAHNIRADITVHVSKGITVQGHDEQVDAYASFDSAAERISKQLQRYKSRLKDHHKRMQEVEAQNASIMAQQFVLSAEEQDQEPDIGEEPAIIAEMATNIETLNVSEAVMRLDLSNEPVVIFKNRSHGGLNVVFRRNDGNIGWVDPERSAKQAAE